MTAWFSDDRYQRLLYRVGEALPTKVVCLQAISIALLEDDEDYMEILEDITDEGSRHGNLVKVVIPRPNHTGAPVARVGKVFLEYTDVEGSIRAQRSMHGGRLDGDQMVAMFYPENKYANGDYGYDG